MPFGNPTDRERFKPFPAFVAVESPLPVPGFRAYPLPGTAKLSKKSLRFLSRYPQRKPGRDKNRKPPVEGNKIPLNLKDNRTEAILFRDLRLRITSS
jgi:hypothetical protein